MFNDGSENVRSAQDPELNHMPSTMVVNDRIYGQNEGQEMNHDSQEENRKQNLEG